MAIRLLLTGVIGFILLAAAGCAEPPRVTATPLAGEPFGPIEFLRVRAPFEPAWAATIKTLETGAPDGPYRFEPYRILESDPTRGFIRGVYPADPDRSEAGQRREWVTVVLVRVDPSEAGPGWGKGPLTDIHVTVEAPASLERWRPVERGSLEPRFVPRRPPVTGDLLRSYSREWPDRRVETHTMWLIRKRIEEELAGS